MPLFIFYCLSLRLLLLLRSCSSLSRKYFTASQGARTESNKREEKQKKKRLEQV